MLTKNNGRPTPLPYQADAVRGIEGFGGRALLAHEMGLGKTITSLEYLAHDPARYPAIVVCPASVKYSWEFEASRFGIQADIAEGRTPPTRRETNPPRLFIINYDILKTWVPYLRKLGPQTIILDECHYLASRESQRTEAVADLVAGVSNVLALSGTPLTNRPAELWPTLNILRPQQFDSFWLYGCEYCEPKQNRGKWEYKGAKNLKQLHRILSETVMLRKRKIDVLSELPSKTRQTIPVALSDSREYRRASDDFLGWLQATKADRVFAAKRAESVVKVGYLLRLAAKLKARAVVGWANDFLKSTDEKLVLFGVHKKMIQVLKKRVAAKSVVVDGSVTGRRRKAAIDKFRLDRDTRVFIGNIRAAGTGIDGLQKAASTAAFAELWWRPGDMIQAEARVDRIGQENPVTINYLIAAGTIEERMALVLQAKQEVINATLDGDADSVDELDILTEMIHEFERKI